MAASFPATLWTWTDQIDNTSAMDAADVNSPAAEIIAIETYLGAGSIVSGQLILNSAAGVDPWVSLQINSVEKFRIGVDDSDSDKLKINTGALADPSLWEMSSTGHIELTNVAETASDPGRHLYLQRIHTGAVGSGKGLTGVEVRSTFNGSADALTAEVKGGEFKARHTTGNTYDVGTFKGVIGNVDVKNGTVTTGWAVEGAIDVSSGGTFTTAACFHGNLNNSGTVTNSYGVYVHGLSGYTLTRGLYVDYATTGIYLDNCTTDIRLQDGATLVNTTTNGGTLTVTEDNIVLVGGGWGKIAFGGYTDWGTGATGTDIDGAGYDWVTSTVGHVDSGALAAAIAAAYHAMTVTVNQTTSTSVFGTWTELYIASGLDLGGSNNYAAVWGQVECLGAVTTPDTGNFMAAVYGNFIAGGEVTLATGVQVNGFRAKLEATTVTPSGTGRTAAFECAVSSATWNYGLYIPAATVGISGIHMEGGTSAAHAISIGTSTTGFQVDGTPDYAIECFADIATGTQTLGGNTGTQNNRLTIAADSTIVSNSFQTASYNRVEIEGNATLSGWNCAVLGYVKNPTGTVGASAALVAGIVSLVNLSSGYTDPAGWTAAYIAGTYGNAGAITDYTGYLVMDQAQDNFDNGFYCNDNAATTAYKAGICTTGIQLAGAMTDGILISGACSEKAIEITGTCDNSLYSVFNVGAQLGQYVQGIKIEHTRSADIQPSTGGWWGIQAVLNAGTGYTALDQPAYVIHGIFKGDATAPSTDCINVARFETQSNGKVEDLLFVSANSGSTVTGDIGRFVAHVAPARSILALQNGTVGSTPCALYIDIDETMTSGIIFDTGAVLTNCIRVTAAANTTYFILADAEAGCFPNYASAGSAIANIKVRIAGVDGYIKVYDAA